jgi:hypothetical protein
MTTQERRAALSGRRLQCSRRMRTLPAALAFVAVTVGALDAQVVDLEQRCLAAAGAGNAACAVAADITEILSSRLPLLAAGGNPVAGTASTFGRRVSAPRLAFTARLSAGSLDLPDATSAGRSANSSALALGADVAIGLTDGFSPAATVGGVASIDALLSATRVLLPSSDGFAGSPFSWAAGLRVGVLRESFTAPGISLSAMYRRTGEVTLGNETPAAGQSFVRLGHATAWTASAAIGKRVALFGLTAGAGETWYSADATVRVRNAAGSPVAVQESSFDGHRFHAFGNLSWTALVWTLSAELGWQGQGGALTAGGRQPASAARGGGLFYGFAARLTL